MSWDVLLIRTKTNRESMDEIKSENIIPFSQAEIAHEIGKLAAELGAVCDCQDLSWQNLDSDGWSIEFNIGKNAETESVMLHIRGGEPKEVLVYSNCPAVELFVNGESQGVKKRDSRDFPAAGLHWEVVLTAGPNTVKAISVGKENLADEISFEYQTEKWGAEARIQLTARPCGDGLYEVSAQVLDGKGIRCLDSRIPVAFEIAGDGALIQNQGTAMGSRKVQARNGRAGIRIRQEKGESVVAVKAEGIPTAFITIK